jgi:hypothetical protein
MELVLYRVGCAAGVLRAAEQMGETVFEVTLYEPLQGIHRIVIEGDRSELLLGVLDTGQTVLRRRLSLAVTEKAGRFCKARAERCGVPRQEWRAVGEGEFPTLPPLPRGALCRAVGVRRYLALPWQEGELFPLTELFCFARLHTMGGRDWVVFAFDEAGNPVFS